MLNILNLCLSRNAIDFEDKKVIGSELSTILYDVAANTPAFVVTKLILAMAVFSIKFADYDNDAIQRFCSTTINVNPDPRWKSYYIKLIVHFLTFIPEEADKMSSFVFKDG